MKSIFISYNSSDKKFAVDLKKAFETLGYKVWVDFEDLKPSVRWWEEVVGAITRSVAFIYLISPKSISNDSFCRKEFIIAEELGKKIIPILLPSIKDPRVLFQEISKYHWIKWEMLADSSLEIEELEKVVRTNFKWVEFHTKLTEQSEEWRRFGKKRIEHPLNGKEILDAQKFFSSIIGDEYPKPTQTIRDYVLANERRLMLLRAVTVFASVSVSLVICASIIIAAYQAYLAQRAVSSVEPLQVAKSAAEATAQAEQERANQEAQNAHVGLLVDQADAIRESNPIISYLLSVELYKRRQNAQTFSLLKKNAYAHSQIFRFVTGANYFAGGSVSSDGLDHFFGPGEQFDTAAISPDGEMLAFSVRDKIILQNINPGENLKVFTMSTNGIYNNEFSYGLAFSPDSKYIASDSKEGKVVLWDIDKGTIWQKLEGFKEGVLIRGLAYSSDGKYIVASSQNDDRLIVWDTDTGEIKCNIKTYSPEYGLSFVPQTYKFITSRYVTLPMDDFSDVSDTILIWEISTCSSNVFFLDQPIGNIYEVSLSGNGNVIGMLASADGIRNIVIWDFLSQRSRLILNEKDTPKFRSLALDFNGKKLAVGYDLGKISIWNVESGDKMNEFQIGADSVNFLAFTPDGRFLLSNGVLWNVDNNFQNEAKGVTHDAMFGDRYNFDIPSFEIIPELDTKYQGATLYVERRSEGVRIVDESDQPIGAPLMGLPSSTRIEVFTFSQDNKLLAIGGNDGTISLWDVSNTRLLSMMNGNPSAIDGLYITSDNKTLTSSSQLGFQTWDIDISAWLNRVCQAAGRNFTLEEWELYFPNENYQKTCPQWIEGK